MIILIAAVPAAVLGAAAALILHRLPGRVAVAVIQQWGLLALVLLCIAGATYSAPAERGRDPQRPATTAESLLRDLQLQRDLNAALATNDGAPGIASAEGSQTTKE